MTGLPFKRVLVFSPHTDDAEFGAGGTIVRLLENAASLRTQAFSLCGEPKLRKEFKAASKVLGAECGLNDYFVRRFPERRQEILDDMLALIAGFHPDAVFCPSSFDHHQDHQTIHQEAVRATKGLTLLGYEIPWNCRTFEASLFVGLSESHVDKKVEALRCYASQAGRPYAQEDYIRAKLRSRGVDCGNGAKYAEAFEVIRWVA